MASGTAIYKRLLTEIPIQEDESVRQYAERVWRFKDDYNIHSANIKCFLDSIRNHLPTDRQVKIKRAETLNSKGEIISEKLVLFLKMKYKIRLILKQRNSLQILTAVNGYGTKKRS